MIYANFQGKNPNEEKVEINVRRNCFMPSKTGVNYITFSGFRVSKAATTWAPPAAYRELVEMRQVPWEDVAAEAVPTPVKTFLTALPRS